MPDFLLSSPHKRLVRETSEFTVSSLFNLIYGFADGTAVIDGLSATECYTLATDYWNKTAAIVAR